MSEAYHRKGDQASSAKKGERRVELWKEEFQVSSDSGPKKFYPKKRQFNPLKTSIERILARIKNDQYVRWPRPLGPEPGDGSRNPTKYCDFHKSHGHETKGCKALRHQIQDLIECGYLQDYVSHPALT